MLPILHTFIYCFSQSPVGIVNFGLVIPSLFGLGVDNSMYLVSPEVTDLKKDVKLLSFNFRKAVLLFLWSVTSFKKSKSAPLTPKASK